MPRERWVSSPYHAVRRAGCTSEAGRAPAMERAVIEAVECNNASSDMRFGAQDVSKIYMMGSYHQAAEFFEIIFNKTVYDNLPPDLQAILEHAAEAASTANYGLAMDRYSADLQTLINKDGVKVYRTPESVMAAQLVSWDKVLEELNKDAYFKKVVDSQRAWVERVVFYELMNAPDYAHWHGFFELQQDLYDLEAIYNQRMETGTIE